MNTTPGRDDRLAFAVVAGIGMLAYFLQADPAIADNCGTVSDCFFTADGTGFVILATVISIGLDFVPIVGDIKGIAEGLYGRDLITGYKLSPAERALSMVGLSEAKWGRRAYDASKYLAKGPGGPRLTTQGKRWIHEDTAFYRSYTDQWERRVSARPLPGSGPVVGADWRHIQAGEINAKNRLVGGHQRSEFDKIPGSRVIWQSEPDTAGVYRAIVERDRPGLGPTTKGTNIIPQPHTFFPDAWDTNRLQQEIFDAFHDAVVKGHGYVPDTGRAFWSGISPSGVRIEGYVDSTGDIVTANPVMLDNPSAGMVGRAAQDAVQVGTELEEL